MEELVKDTIFKWLIGHVGRVQLLDITRIAEKAIGKLRNGIARIRIRRRRMSRFQPFKQRIRGSSGRRGPLVGSHHGQGFYYVIILIGDVDWKKKQEQGVDAMGGCRGVGNLNGRGE